jgi:ferredoxin
MIAEAIEVALSLGWAKERIHFERFGAPRHADDKPFEVQCRRSKRTLTVVPGVTLLETLEQAGIEVPFACRAGSCGACETVVLEGEVEHRDSTMTEADRATGRTMMVCVSRGRTTLVLDV